MFSSNTSQVSSAANYIEDVFSTYLFNGNSSTQTITNGIDLSTYGGMLWTKSRSAIASNQIYDSARGLSTVLVTNSTAAATANTGVTFNTNGFTVGTNDNANGSALAASWTFRKQAKFFDVVTYTGTGADQQISHNLGSVPGCIIVKARNTTGQSWFVYHRGLTANYGILLNSDAAQAAVAGGNGITYGVTSTYFTVQGGNRVGGSGITYVAYLFAHDAGGFGTAGTDNVISCGSYTEPAIGATTSVTLGYEPQFVLFKGATATTGWYIADNMRGMGTTGVTTMELFPNTTDAENSGVDVNINSTGFSIGPINGTTSNTNIYIAIRRGPMKVPTSGTSVFSPITYVGAGGVTQNISAGFPVDADIIKIRSAGGRDPLTHTRLTGPVFLKTDSSISQLNFSDNIVSFSAGQNVIGLPAGTGTNEVNGDPTSTYIALAFRRAPSFMDLVCFTSSASGNKTFNHNLGVSPELMLLKNRQTSDPWIVYSQPTGNNAYLMLNTTDASQPNASSFSVSSTSVTVSTTLMYNSQNYIAYLFASCSGVSKVGSYSGTGATQTISCGFVARFVMIKRTDTTGSWWYWDTGRGMVAGTDPRLAFNSANAETNADWVYTNASGFQIVTTDSTVNASGGTYIYLAIA